MMPASFRYALIPAGVALALLLPAFARAQEVGVKAGLNLASLTPEEDEDPDISWRRGLVAGGWFRTPLGQRVSLQAEGLFSEKGVRFDDIVFVDGGSADIRIRYFELPVLARADFGAPASPTRFFVVGGLAPAFTLSARSKTYVNDDEVDSRDIGDDVYSFDVGLVGGAGVQIGRAVIEGRYTHGLRHINTDDNGDEDRIKNRVFSVTIGFRVW